MRRKEIEFNQPEEMWANPIALPLDRQYEPNTKPLKSPLSLFTLEKDVLNYLVNLTETSTGEQPETHGYIINKFLKRKNTMEGNVMKVLHRMHEFGFLAKRYEVIQSERPERGTPPRQYFTLTPLGYCQAKELPVTKIS